MCDAQQEKHQSRKITIVAPQEVSVAAAGISPLRIGDFISLK